jgi:oligosaccharide translocation protein RFT1
LYLEAYIPLLSLNGILEAFHTSSATPAEIAKQARWMIGSSLAFVAALLLMIRLPKGMMGKEEALLYASCLAMSVRIAYAYLHVRRFFRRPMPVREGNHAEKPDELFRLSRLAPRWPVWGMVLASGSVLRVLEKTGRWRNGWGGWAELMGTGVVLGLASLHLM